MSQINNKKAEYYSSSDVVDNYDARRFVRGGGNFVSSKEEASIASLLKMSSVGAGRTALDCPTGTGRLIPLLKKYGFNVTAADISKTMLSRAEQYKASHYLNESADDISLGNNSVDLWLMSRFCFHFEDPRSFMREAFRVLNFNGYLIADFYNWTPRSWIPGDQAWLGGRTYTHSKIQVTEFATEIGFSVVKVLPVFAVAPYLYSFVPNMVAASIELASELLPESMRAKSYYLFKK